MVETYVITEFYLPKVAALLSMTGSSMIIAEVYQDYATTKGKNLSAVSRILLSMSIADFLFSLGWLLGTWMAPADQPDKDNYLCGTNHGTHATCAFQGFLVQMGHTASLLFNASLAVVYLLLTRYQWRPERFLARNKLLAASVFFWTICLIAALIPLVLDMYHYVGPFCWISTPTVEDCIVVDGVETLACQEGRDATAVIFSLQVIPVWFCIMLDSIIMVLIYRKARSLEQEAQQSSTERSQRRYGLTNNIKNICTDNCAPISQSGIVARRDENSGTLDESQAPATVQHDEHIPTSNHTPQPSQDDDIEEGQQFTKDASLPSTQRSSRAKNRISRIVATQGMWYIAGFFLTYGLATISVLIFIISGAWNHYVDRTSYFFLALQGLWNFLIFSRGRKEMKTRIGATVKAWIWNTPWCSFCCSWSCRFLFTRSSLASSSITSHRHHCLRFRCHEHNHQHVFPYPKVAQHYDSNSHNNNSAAKNNRLDPIDEDKVTAKDLAEMTIEHGQRSDRSGSKSSNWPGFWIWIKETFVSELGASRMSSGCNEFSNYDEQPMDRIPSQPVRAVSRRDIRDRSPPCQPQRVPSEATCDVTETSPSSKPMRFVSEVTFCEAMDEPPTKPLREVSSFDDDAHHDCAPRRPFRYVSEVSTVEQLEGAARPTLSSSEVAFTLDNKGETENTHKYPERAASGPGGLDLNEYPEGVAPGSRCGPPNEYYERGAESRAGPPSAYPKGSAPGCKGGQPDYPRRVDLGPRGGPPDEYREQHRVGSPNAYPESGSLCGVPADFPSDDFARNAPGGSGEPLCDYTEREGPERSGPRGVGPSDDFPEGSIPSVRGPRELPYSFPEHGEVWPQQPSLSSQAAAPDQRLERRQAPMSQQVRGASSMTLETMQILSIVQQDFPANHGRNTDSARSTISPTIAGPGESGQADVLPYTSVALSQILHAGTRSGPPERDGYVSSCQCGTSHMNESVVSNPPILINSDDSTHHTRGRGGPPRTRTPPHGCYPPPDAGYPQCSLYEQVHYCDQDSPDSACGAGQRVGGGGGSPVDRGLLGSPPPGSYRCPTYIDNAGGPSPLSRGMDDLTPRRSVLHRVPSQSTMSTSGYRSFYSEAYTLQGDQSTIQSDYQHHYEGSAHPPLDNHDDSLRGLLLEVAPGLMMHLVDTDETMKAIQLGHTTVAKCVVCKMDVHCHPASQYVLCPDCRVVSPISQLDEEVDMTPQPGGLVGLGVKTEMLITMMEAGLCKSQLAQTVSQVEPCVDQSHPVPWVEGSKEATRESPPPGPVRVPSEIDPMGATNQ